MKNSHPAWTEQLITFQTSSIHNEKVYSELRTNGLKHRISSFKSVLCKKDSVSHVNCMIQSPSNCSRPPCYYPQLRKTMTMQKQKNLCSRLNEWCSKHN